MEIKTQLVVVGGGAAGLICAGTAAARGLKVIICEKNARCARKVMITGKGRCNVTNMSDRNELIASVATNGRFLYSAFSAFTPNDVCSLIESLGVPLKVERGNRVFPVSDKAVDIVDALVKYAVKNGAEIINEAVVSVEQTDGKISAVVTETDRIACDACVIATGGKSYPMTGSTGDGYEFARSLGHCVTAISPSLVPLEAHEGYCSEMMGLSLKNIAITVTDNTKNKVIYEDFGEMIFTHFGVSGPVILSASCHMKQMQPEKYTVHIDMKPALDESTLDSRILRDFSENNNRDFINSLSKLLPQKMVPTVVRLSGIPAGEKVNQITKEQRRRLCEVIKNIPVTVTGFRPIEEAIITSGGVSVKEINPKTMESKLVENLYFAGEIIDADAYTGGFNLQIAFSTGYVAGTSVLS